MRLGCGPGLMGRPGLRSHDGRRPPALPHLSVSLAYLRDARAWLERADLHMLRLHWALAPGPAEVALAQISECAAELAMVGADVRASDIRLTVHASLTACLGAIDPDGAARAGRTLQVLAALLDGLGADAGGVIVVHIGGGRGDGDALSRFTRRYQALPEPARRRLAVEHDAQHSLAAALELHARCGVPVVFDYLHYRLYDDGEDVRGALAESLATWPTGRVPKIHFSSLRTEARIRQVAAGRVARLPRPGEHADLINPFEFRDFLKHAIGLPAFDVLLEARASDVAVLRLRGELACYAPALALNVR